MVERTDDAVVYECERCGRVIVNGLVATNGKPARPGLMRPPPHVLSNGEVAADTTWNTWEAWWTRKAYVVAIHGVVVSGQQELLDFAEKLQEKHD